MTGELEFRQDYFADPAAFEALAALLQETFGIDIRHARSLAGMDPTTMPFGYFDADGYLFITGRLKELINRGGEKISPREVDDALLEHPDVALVVTFAMPHPKLGEEVAAAVVLKPGARLDESELRAFARGRLAAFKVPRRVVFVAEIPKGPTGKLRRIGLAQALGLG